ncbi:hypothetical protein RI367_003406 [Sorochytrium milnesiophthora]
MDGETVEVVDSDDSAPIVVDDNDEGAGNSSDVSDVAGAKETVVLSDDDPRDSAGDQVTSFRVDRTAIQPLEKTLNAEFFTLSMHGKLVRKTPDRYVKIRNHILDMWKAKQPAYVSKSAIRPGLKDCGDVHAISRVHTFLEVVGAINSGHKKALQVQAAFREEQSVTQAPRLRSTSIDRPTEDAPEIEPLPPRKRRRKETRDATDDDILSLDSDQLMLIKPLTFVDIPQPFSVSIDSCSMMLMDLHAHLEDSEVIGLLGGRYDDDNNALSIELAYPCKSTGTSTQCEMDPRSEMEARELFFARGLVSVGWYHSHPVFDTIPSVRDIETQSMYQMLFRRDDGVEPFVSAIISPFNPANHTTASQCSFTIVQGDLDSRVPYSCQVNHVHHSGDMAHLTQQARMLLERPTLHKVKWSARKQYEGHGILTRREKMLQSLRSHQAADTQETNELFALVDNGSCSLAPEFLQQLRAGGGDNPALIAEQILTKLQKAAGDATYSSVALRREPTKVATLLELCWNTDDKHVQRAVLLVAAQLLSDSVLFTVLTMGNNLQAKIIARLQRDGDGDATSSLVALQALYSATRRRDDQIFLAEAALPRVLHLLAVQVNAASCDSALLDLLLQGTCQMAVLFNDPIPPQRLEHLLSDIVRLLGLGLARSSDRTHLVVVRTLLLLAKRYSALVLERHKCDRLFVRMLRHPSAQLRYTVLAGLLAAARTPPASVVVRDQLQYPPFGNVRLLSPAIKAAILAHPDSFYVKWARYSGEVKRIMSGEPAATQAKLLAGHLLESPFLLPSDSTSTDEERRQAVKWLTRAVEQLNKQPPALLLDIHLCLLTGDAARTRKLCDSVIVPLQGPRTSRSVQDQRHPLIYLMRCLVDDNHASRLKLAKRGLSMQTPKAEGFVRLGLLEVSVLSLVELAMQDYNALSELTLVYLRTASEDAEQYLSCAPLDAPALSRMAICRFLCRVVLEAPRSLDIADVHRVQKALSSVDPVHRALYHTSHHWCPRDVYNLVAKWAPALWPEAMDTPENESSAPLDDETCRRLRCANCQRPAENLIKCAGCSIDAHYCDASCQTEHRQRHLLTAIHI